MATNNLEKDFGDCYVNVGIMEAEMVGLAAGFIYSGFRPYLHIWPFASRRVFDQLFISLDTHNWMPLLLDQMQE